VAHLARIHFQSIQIEVDPILFNYLRHLAVAIERRILSHRRLAQCNALV
jgi:hypothetical protein